MAIPFRREFAFDYGVPARVSGRVVRLVADNPGPFTFTGTGVFVVGAGEEVAVIDPGPDTPAHRAALWELLDGRRVAAVLLTHHHLDHTPLARPVAEEWGCPVYGRSVVDEAAFETEALLEEGADLTFRPDVEGADGDVVAGEGWTLRALHTPGHTSNHICWALEEENALFTGDHIMGWSTSVVVPPDGVMADYMASLRRVRDAGFATLYPTHGPEIAEPRAFVEAYIAHREGRERQALEALSEVPRDVPDMVAEIYAETDPRLYPAAAQSLLAHLIHLEAQGLAVQSKGAWRLSPFPGTV